MAEQREALRDEDFDYLFEDFDYLFEDRGDSSWWAGAVPALVEAPTSTRVNRGHEHPDTGSWNNDGDTAAPVRRIVAPASGVSAWNPTLALGGGAWYRTKPAIIALIVVGVVAVLVLGILLLGSPDSGAGEPTVAPSAPPSPEQSAPSSVESPSASVAPPAPPPSPPPPPPPAPAQTGSGSGSDSSYYPRQSAPSQTSKPEIGVTRTPQTRAPISVAPEPRPVPGSNSATPGDGPKRGGWHW